MYQPVQQLSEWPILKISRDSDRILNEVIEESIKSIKAEYNTTTKLRKQLAKALHKEKIRIKTEPWRVDPKDERKFWNRIKKDLYDSDPAKVSDEVAGQVADKLLREIVSRYTIEISGNFDPRFYRFAKRVLPFVFSRMLNAFTGKLSGIIKPNKELVNKRLFVRGPIDQVRNLSQQGTLILLPTHFSNLDSIMVGFGMDSIGLPAFQYGAGLNLYNSKFFGFFMNNLGSYRLDRRKKNSIYINTLKAFSRINILNGAHTLFFTGGTRSRSGSIEEHLKLGLLGTVIEAQRKHIEAAKANGGEAKKLYVVPLTMSYHFVLEAKTLIDEYLKRKGKELYITIDDEFTSLYKIFKFMSQAFSKSSSIVLSLGEPMDVFGNKLDADGKSLDKNGQPLDIAKYFISDGAIKEDAQREREYTNMLGDELLKKFYKYNVAFSSHLVAFVAFELITRKYPDADIFTILRLPEEDWEISYAEFYDKMELALAKLKELESEEKILLAEHMNRPVEEVIQHGVKNIGIYHSKEPLKIIEDGLTVISEDIKLLYFYHNRMRGYELEKYF